MSATKHRERQILRVILLEGLANVVVLLVKLQVGIATGSLAILGDAVHSLTDVFNNVVAWFVTRHSSRPADAKHPYGHRKFETIAVFCLGALLVALAFELSLQAVSRDRTEVVTGTLELALMIGVLLVNTIVTVWQRKWAKRLNSDILFADASHTFSDVLTTISVIIGWQLAAMGWAWIDRLCALAVAGLIFYLAFSLFRRALPVLLDERAIDEEELRCAVQGIDGVCAIKRVRSRWIGPASSVDLVIDVDASLSTLEAHDIADRVESLLENQFEVKDASIHIEPYNNDGG